MSRPLVTLAAVSAALVAATLARAEPAGGAIGPLDRDHFRSTVLPAVKPGGTLVVHADDGRYARLFAEVVAPRFARAHGIAVHFAVVPSDAIVAELAAARAAGRPSPADLVLAGERTQRRLIEQGLDAGLDLAALLPNARDVARHDAAVADAAHTAGAAVPFAIERQVVAYDSARVAADEVAGLARLAGYAATHPGRFGYVRASGLGDGAAFAETVTVSLADGRCRSRVYDADLTPADAAAWAEGRCGEPVVGYFRALRHTAATLRSPAELLWRLGRGDLDVAVTNGADVAEAALRGALPASVRVVALPGQVSETAGLLVPAGGRDPAAALALADDLMSTPVQRAKLERFGSASARASVRPADAFAGWFADAPATGGPHARPVSTLARAVQLRLAAEMGGFAAR